ncbi:MAG TPA: M23 family metallopeptidase [Elusimicrobiales bacterium]|nr:M23 family metallopeptidase [Elusimicrobiales bacterium]
MRKFKVRSRQARIFQNRFGAIYLIVRFLVQFRLAIFISLAVTFSAYTFTASYRLKPGVFIKRGIFSPGQTIKISADNTRHLSNLKCKLKDRVYPFFEENAPASDNLRNDKYNPARALVPIPLKIAPGLYELDVSIKGETLQKTTILIKDTKAKPIMLNIASFKIEERKHPDVKKEDVLIKQIISAQLPQQMWKGLFELPANARFSAPFGEKRLLPDDTNYFHRGLDIAIVSDTPVLAVNDGVVEHTGKFKIGGNSVYVNHGQGVFTLYCHLNSFTVKKGDRVKKGQVIAKSGSTGFSNSPHLHWSVIVGGHEVDPLQWTREEF